MSTLTCENAHVNANPKLKKQKLKLTNVHADTHIISQLVLSNNLKVL